MAYGEKIIIGVHRESFIPFKWIVRSDGMTEKMIIVQIGTEQHYSLWTDLRDPGSPNAMQLWEA